MIIEFMSVTNMVRVVIYRQMLVLTSVEHLIKIFLEVSYSYLTFMLSITHFTHYSLPKPMFLPHFLMQSYSPRALDRRLQEDWAKDATEGPRVLMSLRVYFGPMG